jgi:hypothetical protein
MKYEKKNKEKQNKNIKNKGKNKMNTKTTTNTKVNANTNTKTTANNNNANAGVAMFHEITIVGKVGQKLDLRFTDAGEAIFEFWVECVRDYKVGALKQQETYKFKVSMWGDDAKFYYPRIQGGAMLRVRGRLLCNPKTGGPRLYMKNGGEQTAAFEVRARDVAFIGNANPNGKGK